MDWDIDSETLHVLGGERLTVTFNVVELVPGTYMYLDADNEIIMCGVIPDTSNDALLDFSDENLDEEDTNPNGRTIVGPPPAPRTSKPVTPPAPGRTATIKGPLIQPRPPVPIPDQILNEIDDVDADSDHTIMGPLITPRLPAPRRR